MHRELPRKSLGYVFELYRIAGACDCRTHRIVEPFHDNDAAFFLLCDLFSNHALLQFGLCRYFHHLVCLLGVAVLTMAASVVVEYGCRVALVLCHYDGIHYDGRASVCDSNGSGIVRADSVGRGLDPATTFL